MDKKNKIFLLVFFGAIFLSVGATWYKYFISRDYFIQAEAECDPEVEKCFIYECSSEDDPECPEDESERTSYYKLIRKKAYAIPECDPNDENCPPLFCGSDEECEYILCSEETVEEGESCNDPEEYLKVGMEESVDGEEALEEDVLAENPDEGGAAEDTPGDVFDVSSEE